MLIILLDLPGIAKDILRDPKYKKVGASIQRMYISTPWMLVYFADFDRRQCQTDRPNIQRRCPKCCRPEYHGADRLCAIC